jgi:protein-L-isoaspartate(D-aspartate) O-methyltransferase
MKREFVDTYQHKGLRKKLVDLLKEKGITDTKVLDAMNAIPRHFFLDSAFDKIAYENRAFDIGAEQTISHPYTVAYQTQLLQVKKLEKVLEIGTGSMYQSAVLAELGVWLFSIERQKQLYDEKSKFFVRTKYHNTKFFYGDGFEGLATYAPFDKILITAAAPFIPPKLLTQLKIGGMMVIPLDEGTEQRMLRITKMPDGSFQEESFEAFSFVPMLTGKNR